MGSKVGQMTSVVPLELLYEQSKSYGNDTAVR
jgi:hypothetical protein